MLKPLHRPLFLLALCAGAWFGARPAAAITWTGETLHDGDATNDSTSWLTPENWDLLRAPQTGETVIIDNGDTVTLPTAITVSDLVFSSGTLAGPGVLDVTGSTVWLGGTVTGATLSIGAAGTLQVSGTNDKTLDAATLTNNGNTIWTAPGRLLLSNGCTIANNGTFDIAGDGIVTTYASGANSNFNNNGTVTKSGGLATAFLSDILVNNNGSLTCASGTLSLNAGGSSAGSFTAGPGATVEFTGGIHALSTGAAFDGTGIIGFIGGTFDCTGNVNLAATATMIFSGGTLTGSGSFTNAGTLHWTGGAVTSTTLNNVAGATLNLSGGIDKNLTAATINNVGATNWSGIGRLVVGNAATFDNNGTFNVLADGNITAYSAGADSSFNNAGTLTKLGPAGTATLADIVFNNSGTASSASGTLALPVGGASSGIFGSTASAAIDFTGGNHNFAAGTTLDGSGHIIFSAATITLLGAVTQNGNGTLDLTGGNLTGAGDLTVGATMNWTGGALLSTVLTVAAGGTLNVTGDSDKALNAVALTNHGILRWSGAGRVVASNGATITNQGTFDIASDGTVTGNGGGNASLFNNLGTLTKSGGTGDATLADIDYNNEGTTTATSGFVVLPVGGTHSGAFGGNGQAGVDFSGGDHRFDAGASIAGGGHVRFSGGTFDLAAPLTIATGATLDFNGGTISGVGSLDVATGTLNWTGGALTNNINIEAAGMVTCSGASDKLLNGLTIANHGTFAWGGSGLLLLRNGTIFNNLSGSRFEIGADGSVFANTGGATSTFNNTGTIAKTGGPDIAVITDLDVTQNQAVDVQSGILTFGAPLTVGSGATFTGSLTRFSGATVTLAGPATIGGRLELNSGTLTGTGTLNTAAGGEFIWSGGTIQNTCASDAGGIISISGAADKLLNGGTLQVAGVATWTGDGRILLSNNALCATQSGGTFNWQGSGNFIHNGGVASTVANAGTLNLGPEIGTFTIGGQFTQSLTGTLNFLVGGYSASLNYDQLLVTGASTLDGVVGGVLVNGFKPDADFHFIVLSCPGRSGVFFDTAGPFSVVHNTDSVELVSTPAVELKAQLYAEQEVQTPAIVSDAGGSAVVEVNAKRTAVDVTLDTTGLANVNAAHIHIGALGENGPIAFSLYSTGDGAFPPHLTRTLRAADFIGTSAAPTLTEALDAIIAGNAYINVHTDANPTGEIRGQILPAAEIVASVSAVTPTANGVGTLFDITGTNFTAPTGVRLNGKQCPSTFGSATSLSATVAASATTGPVVVLTPTGASTENISFTVEPAPTITGITPTTAAVGDTITIDGTDFINSSTPAPSVAFDNVVVAAADVTIVDATRLLVVIPAAAITGKVSVTTTGGTAITIDDFVVLHPPIISAFSPESGPVGQVVTLSGLNFTTTTTMVPVVTLNGAAIDPASITVTDGTQLSFVVASDATSGPIGVGTSDGTVSTATEFVVALPPAIVGFSPGFGGPGSTVTIEGVNFTNAATPRPAVKFNGSACADSDFVRVAADQLSVKVPVGATTGPISVENTGGTSVSGLDFTVLPAPVITAFAPTSGSPGTEITIYGANFTNDTTPLPQVKFNLTPAADVDITVVSPSQLKVKVPVGATTGKLTLSTTGGAGVSSAIFGVVPKPTVTGFTPASGGVGSQITIVGASLTNATTPKPTVLFNGVAVAPANVAVVAASQVRAKVPAGATNGKISVITTGGTAVSPGSFIVVPLPTISTFSPASAAAGAIVTINGTNFTNVTTSKPTVKFKGVAAKTVTVVSASQIKIAVPVSAGTAKLTVETTAGTATSSTNFTVVGATSVSTFTPTSGAEGTAVIVSGTNFVNTTTTKPTVKFNNTVVPPANVTVLSYGIVKVLVPAGATTGKISVETTGGIGTSAASFIVVAKPSITSFTPTSGAYNMAVTINGTNFTNATTTKPTLKFNTAAVAPVNVTVVNSTQIKALVPVGAVTGKISVTTTGGTASSSATFVGVTKPTVYGFTPTSGAVGTAVTVTGVSLVNSTTAKPTVAFNGTPVRAADIAVASANQIKVLVPAGATNGKITVTTSGGAAVGAANFTVVPVPTLTSFSPDHGPVGTMVVINGTNLTNATSAKPTVKFNTTAVNAAAVTVVSSSQVKVLVPAGATAGKITVETTGGTLKTSTNFTPVPKPTIIVFSPGSAGVGAVVTINGTGLTNVLTAKPTIKFNGIAAPPESITVISVNQVKVIVPGGATTGRVTVETSGGSVQSLVAFLVLPSPIISSFAPTSGAVGTLITITGANFTDALTPKPTVYFNSIPVVAVDVAVLSSTQIQATVPSGGTTGKIAVETNSGTTFSSGIFTVTPPITRSAAGNSKLQLSSAVGRALTNSITLTFSGPLDTGTVTDDLHYSVTVNGQVAKAEGIFYNSAARSITLALPNSTLRSGDTVIVAWDGLQDATGSALTGQATFVAR